MSELISMPRKHQKHTSESDMDSLTNTQEVKGFEIKVFLLLGCWAPRTHSCLVFRHQIPAFYTSTKENIVWLRGYFI